MGPLTEQALCSGLDVRVLAGCCSVSVSLLKSSFGRCGVDSMRRVVALALTLVLILFESGAGAQSLPSFYHKTDEILEFFRSTSLKLPQRVR